MKDQAFAITKTTRDEFSAWCKENKLPSYTVESKREFFMLIRKGELVRDSETGELVRKDSRE